MLQRRSKDQLIAQILTGNALLCVLKEMILGSALWLSAVLFQTWIPRSIILAIATFGTALWLVGIVNICTIFVRELYSHPSCDLEVSG